MEIGGKRSGVGQYWPKASFTGKVDAKIAKIIVSIVRTDPKEI